MTLEYTYVNQIPQIPITESLKASVVSQLKTITPNTLLGMALQHFSTNAECKTDEDFRDLFTNLYAQFHEDPVVCKKVLGGNFIFFEKLLF